MNGGENAVIQTVLISPNLRKQGIADAVRQTCAVLAAHGARLLLPREAAMLAPEGYSVTCLELEQAAAQADVILVLGGDGTILRIAGLAARVGTPILGVNMGHVGFMTEFEPGEIDMVARLFTDDLTIDDRMMLSVEIERAGQTVFADTALNEVMVTKEKPFHIIRLELWSDGERVMSYKGDGMIIATPTGTTAYSHSAGGPIIEPTAENLAVTPVCPFTIGAKPLVFAPHRTLTVCASGVDGGAACVSADGKTGFEMRPGDLVRVRRAPDAVRLVRIKDRNFYQILQHKLSDGGGDR